MRKRTGLPLRIILSLLFLIISLALTRLGQMQHQEFVRAAGQGGEGLQSDYAVARNIDLGINAPALIPAWILDRSLNGEGNYLVPVMVRLWGWWYLFFTLMMWFFIGHRLDHWKTPERADQPESPPWRKNGIRLLVAIYGIALCFYIFKDIYDLHLYYATFESYLTYFTVPVYGWGVILIFAAFYPFSSDRKRIWGISLGTLAALVGMFECLTGAIIYSRVNQTQHMDLYFSPIVTIVIFGALLLLEGTYLLWRSIPVPANAP